MAPGAAGPSLASTQVRNEFGVQAVVTGVREDIARKLVE